MPGNPLSDYDIVPYQTTHNTGGTIRARVPMIVLLTITCNIGKSIIYSWLAQGIFLITAVIIQPVLSVRFRIGLQKELLNTVKTAVRLSKYEIERRLI